MRKTTLSGPGSGSPIVPVSLLQRPLTTVRFTMIVRHGKPLKRNPLLPSFFGPRPRHPPEARKYDAPPVVPVNVRRAALGARVVQREVREREGAAGHEAEEARRLHEREAQRQRHRGRQRRRRRGRASSS